jgi:outer membrane receptor protein involved in Fe transport
MDDARSKTDASNTASRPLRFTPQNEKRGFKVTLLSASIAAALYPVMPALAQEQERESDRILEEVLVTATLREVSMQDLPQSLQAITGEDIVRTGITDFVDVANAIPSLTVIADMPGRNSVKFRGISTGTGEYYTDSLVAIYMDETPLTFISQQLWPAMVDVERVESLPGPQGTLFGSSSLAGTLRIISNKPDPTEFSGEVSSEIYSTDGGDSSWSLDGHINIPLIADTLGLRLVAYARDEGGWLDNVYAEAYVQPADHFQSPGNNSANIRNDWNKFKLTGGRATLRWINSENWQSTFTFLTESSEADGNWGEDPSIGDEQTALFHDEFRDDEWWNISMLIEGDLGFATLTSSTTYLDREITYEWENMVYEQYKDSYWGVYYGFVLYNTEYTYGHIFNDQTQDRFSQEIRLTSQSEGRFQWMIGGFYEDVDDQWYYGADNRDMMDTGMWYYANYWAYYYNYYGYDIGYPLTPSTVGYSNTLQREISQKAVFGEMSYEFTDKWAATMGVRWFEFERDELINNQFPEGLPPWGTMDTDGTYISSSKSDDTVFKFSTQYSFDDDKMVYILYSEGFRLGGENSPRAANTGLVPRVYGSDTMKNYEMGLKSDFLDGSLRLNATLFRLTWKDRQFNWGSVDGQWWLRGAFNGGKTETDGFEIDLTWQATDNLRLEGRLTKLDGKTTTLTTYPNGTLLPAGVELPNAPELSYYLSADYTFPWTPFDGVFWGRIDYAYGDSWWNSTNNARDQDPDGLIPDWNITNLKLGLALPNDWTITAYVNNLTEERRINSRQNNSYASDWFGVDRFRTIEYTNRPRTFGFTLRKKFD